MEGKIALIGDFATDWIRYNNYEIKKTSSGEEYIIPTEDATFSMYNPFNVAEDLLLNLIKIGDIALKFEKESNDNNKELLNSQILIFAKKYGLLGLISASAYNRNIVGDEKVLLIENNHVTKEKILDESTFIGLFTPFIEEGDIYYNKFKKGVDIVKSEDSPKFYGKRPVILDLVFSRFYSENIEWIIDFAKLISSHFNQLLVYKKTSIHLTEGVTIMAGKFHAQKIGFTISQLDKTIIAWEFDSLKAAIETIYAFAVTDETTVIDRCKHCKDVYISNNIRAKYCNTTCRNRANVQKSRKRKSSN